MTTTKKIIWIIVLIAVLLLIWLAGGRGTNPAPSGAGESIKVGVIAPLSGDLASIGEELKRGVDLAIDQLQGQGVEIEAVYEDSRFDPQVSATVAHKLISTDKVDLAVLFSVEEARPVVSIFNEGQVPLVALWDSNQFLTDAGPYIFSNGFSTEQAGKDMADFATDKLKFKKVAVLGHVDAWSEIISENFKTQFVTKGGQVVFDEAVQLGTNDFRAIILKIKATKPDVVYLPLIPFDSVSFIKQAKETGLTTPILSGDGLIQDVISATEGAAEGIYFTNAYPETSDLATLYLEKYGQEAPALTFVASGYDGLLKIGLGLDPDKTVKESLDEVFGPTRSANRQEKIYQVKSGVPVEVK